MTQLTEQKQTQKPPARIEELLNSQAYKERLKDVMGERAGIFAASIVTLSKTTLADCRPDSIIQSCLIAASMQLPISKDLGFAWIVPYNENQSKVAQFQMGYKGYIQLAQRTNAYNSINVCEVFEGELVEFNRFTGKVVLDQEKKTSDKIVGYYAFFEMKNGYSQHEFWTTEKVTEHAKKFSKTYGKATSTWSKDFDKMAKKTVLKSLLSTWGMLSIEYQQDVLQRALKADQAVMTEEGEYTYVDNPETKTYVKEIPNKEEVDWVKLVGEPERKPIKIQAIEAALRSYGPVEIWKEFIVEKGLDYELFLVGAETKFLCDTINEYLNGIS